jgi:hypothetical protein
LSHGSGALLFALLNLTHIFLFCYYYLSVCEGLGVAIAKLDKGRDRLLIVLPRFSIFSQFLGYIASQKSHKIAIEF